MMDIIKRKRLELTIRILSITALSYALIFPYNQSKVAKLISNDLKLVHESILIKSSKLSTISKFISIYIAEKYREDEIKNIDKHTLEKEVNDLLLIYSNVYQKTFDGNTPQYQSLPEPIIYNLKTPHSGIENINKNIDNTIVLTLFEFVLIKSGDDFFNIGNLKLDKNLSNHPILRKITISNESLESTSYSIHDHGFFSNIIIDTLNLSIGEHIKIPYYISLGEVIKRDALTFFLILILTLTFFILKIGLQTNKSKINIMVDELNRDPLTRLLNRRHLNKLLNNEELKNYTITIVDGNKIKNINDTYGHNIGDLAIKHIANILHTHTRHSDLVYRLGGDEFLILFLNMPGEAIDNLMVKINSILKKSVINEHTIPISISYGYAHICNYKCHEEAFKMADDLLYRSKISTLEMT